MEDKNLLSLIRRIDTAERRIMEHVDKRVKPLEEFRWKVIGGAILMSWAVSLVFEIFKH